MSSSLSGLRKKHEIEIENLTLTSQPFRTLKLFILATILYVKRSISFLLTKGSWFLLLSILTAGFGVLLITIDGPHEKAKRNNKIQISILNMKNSIAGIFLSINDWKPVFLTRIPHVEEFLQYFRFGLWWVALGVASSIGLGSGLHTFVLYLGPHIALFTIKAMKCGRVDLKSAPYDTIQLDRSASWLDKNCSEFGPPMFPAVGGLSVPLSSILPQVQLEAILWGFGTALGELPPYFISRAASMSGATLDAMEELNVSSTEDEGFISRHLNQLKRWFFSHAQHLNFFSILVLASVPNPLFDLAGIMCGQFGIPFWNFFLATLIGKAIVKTHIQTAFIISVCNNQLLDWIENELIWVLGFVPGLSSILPNLISKLHAVKEKYLAPPAPVSSSDEVQKWWNLSITSVWNTVVWLMLFNFFIKIVNSTAQRYLKKQQECEMVALTNKLAANSNGEPNPESLVGT